MEPLKIPHSLAPTPLENPIYKTTVKNGQGKDVVLADPNGTRALVAIMNQFAINGGAAAHWGGPAAFAEIMSAIHGLMFQDKSTPWFEQFNFVNDAGHTENGIYALRANYGFDKLKIEDLFKFRSIQSKLTGHGEAHLNPEGVYISNGPLGSGVPQAQGLAIADKILKNKRITICTLSDGGAMEGETKESLASIPGLAHKGKVNPFILVISDNNTKLSGRIEEDSFSMEPTFNSLSVLGWDVVRVEKGNDLEKVYLAIENAIKTVKAEKPIAIICKTVKGFGVKSTEEDSSGGHGYPLKSYSDKLISFLEEIYGKNLPSEMVDWAQTAVKKPESKPSAESAVKSEKIQPGFSRAAIKAAKEGYPLFSISADLQGSTGIEPFHEAFPDRYLDIGVSESNMVSCAIGLSKQGLIPIVDTFAQFGITKGNLPLIMSALSQGPLIALFSHTGFQDAADGASHQATTYLAATSAIPHTTCVVVSCSMEAEALMYQAIERFAKERKEGKIPDSVLFFLGRENYPQYYDSNMKYPWGSAQVYKSGSDLTIVASGSTLTKALEAHEELSKLGINTSVIHNPFVNHPDIMTIGEELKKTKNKLITIEDHQMIGGMGAQLIHALKLKGFEFKVKCLANHGKFGQSAYKADHLYEMHGLDTKSLVKAAKEII
jgi:transketolase